MPLDAARVIPEAYVVHRARPPEADFLTAAKRAHQRQQASAPGAVRQEAQVQVARTWAAMLEVQRRIGWL